MRGTLNLFLISFSSSLIKSSSKASLFSRFSSLSISFKSSFSSFSIFSLSSPVRRPSLISSMALAWASLSLNSRIKPSLATTLSALALIKAMTASMLSRAILSPSKICALVLAFCNSKMLRRMMTVFLCVKKIFKSSIKEKIFGSLLLMASIMTPKVLSIVVDLKRLLRTISLIASLFSSMTTRMPSLSLSSLTSLMPSICFSLTNSAICSIKRALFV